MKKKNIGSTFDSLLREEGLYEPVNAAAIKRVVARQVRTAMVDKGLTKMEAARRTMKSRAPVPAEAIARLADQGKDVSRFFTNRGQMMGPIQRAAVPTPTSVSAKTSPAGAAYAHRKHHHT